MFYYLVIATIVTSKIVDNTVVTTMIKNWPDAIRCGDSVFMLHAVNVMPESFSLYKQVFSVDDSSGDDNSVAFNAVDGTYNSRHGNYGSSDGCLGKSIS